MKTRTILGALLSVALVLAITASAQAVGISANLGGANPNTPHGYRGEFGGYGQAAHNYALVDGVVPLGNWNFVNFGTNLWSGHGNSFPDAGVIDSAGNAVAGFSTYFWGDGASFACVGVGPRTPTDPLQAWVSGSIFGNLGVSENGGNRVYSQLNDIPYATYDLYVYTSERIDTTQATANSNPQRIRVTGQSQIQYTPNVADMTAGVFNDASTDGDGNYVKYTGMTTSSITITAENGGSRSGNLVGWQIVDTSQPAAPNFTATPGSLPDFGTVGVSTVSPVQTVTLTNIGNAAGNVTAATVTGGFAFTAPLPGTPTYSVAPAGTAVYGIELPAQTLPGSYAGVATFTTSTGVFTYDLSATVVAHAGDVNGDGQVSLLDYNVIKANFGNAYESGNHWGDGDVNGDHQVGLLDFNIVKAHFGHTTGDGAAVTAVPEPATISLLALAGLAALRRKQ